VHWNGYGHGEFDCEGVRNGNVDQVKNVLFLSIFLCEEREGGYLGNIVQ
jgi:hypothetical protein